MGKGKSGIKFKKVPVGSKDDTDTLNKMFEQMTGISNAEPDVIIPKILKIKNALVKYVKLFNILLGFSNIKSKLSEYKHWFDEIQQFLDKLLEQTNTNIEVVYDENSTDQINDLKKITIDDLNKMYKSLKECSFIKEIIITCSNLAAFKKYLENKDKLDDKFIYKEPGLSLIPLSFSGLDLKLIWNIDDITQKDKNFVLSILHHAYVVGWEIYDIVSSPDVDIGKFSEILIKSITKLRKQIPRCDKAFDVIENSVKLLEENFKNYYKTSVEAENPSIIIESFIMDVSTTQKASPLVTAQFRRIVAYLKQKSAGNNDPKIKQLFSMLNTQFSAMDKEFGVSTDKDEETENDPRVEEVM